MQQPSIFPPPPPPPLPPPLFIESFSLPPPPGLHVQTKRGGRRRTQQQCSKKKLNFILFFSTFDALHDIFKRVRRQKSVRDTLYGVEEDDWLSHICSLWQESKGGKEGTRERERMYGGRRRRKEESQSVLLRRSQSE